MYLPFFILKLNEVLTMLYPEVVEFFNTCRNPERGKPTGKKALTIIKTDDGYALEHYNTNIITWKENGSIVIDTSYQSITTKQHINAYIPDGWWISQKSGTWYMYSPHGIFDIIDNEFTIPAGNIYAYFLNA